MAINLKAPELHELRPRITVLGVGGAGGNAVNNMISSHLEGVEFVVANTDAQALAQSKAERRIQLGSRTTEGLGAGASPDVGKAGAEESLDEIMEHGRSTVFITVGMGGGRHRRCPVIARAVRRWASWPSVVASPSPSKATAACAPRTRHPSFSTSTRSSSRTRTCSASPRPHHLQPGLPDGRRSAILGVRACADLIVMPGLINSTSPTSSR